MKTESVPSEAGFMTDNVPLKAQCGQSGAKH